MPYIEYLMIIVCSNPLFNLQRNILGKYVQLDNRNEYVFWFAIEQFEKTDWLSDKQFLKQ